MKKYILIFISILTVGCTSTGVQVTFDDEKSNLIRSHFQNYLANDMDGLKSLWSSDLKVYPNSTEPVSMDELVGMLEAQHATFSPITMTFGGDDSDANAFVETTNYPDTPVSEASTWSQAWFTWNATSKMTGEMISLPGHISFKWGDDGKISEEYHFYDTTAMVAAIQAAASESE